jgi:hypothetical protein
MSTLDKMTLEELRALETERYGRYVDWYDHAGMDAGLWAELDEVRSEVEKRHGRELICVPAERTSLVA